MKTPLKVIAWDLDGTLYSVPPELEQAINQAKIKAIAQRRGIAQHQAQNLFDQTYQRLNSNTKTLTKLGVNGQQFFINIWLKLDLTQYIDPNPELAALLRSIHDRPDLKQYMLTNSNTKQTVQAKLECVGIELTVFDQIFTSVELGVNKPEKKAFQVLWQTAQVKPQEVVYIADRMNTDIKPARKYGLQAVWVDGSQGAIVSELKKEEVLSRLWKAKASV